jgi:hypothetical protein
MENVYNIFTKKKMPGWDEVAGDLSKRLIDIQNKLIPVLEENDFAPINVAMAMIIISEKIAYNIENDGLVGPINKNIDKGLDHFRDLVRKSQKMGEF